MKFKIGLVGCGRISKNHFEAIQEEKKLELVSVCDIDKKKAETAGKEYAVPFFTDQKKMLIDVPMDLISICTPSGVHPQNGILAAEHGVVLLRCSPHQGSG